MIPLGEDDRRRLLERVREAASAMDARAARDLLPRLPGRIREDRAAARGEAGRRMLDRAEQLGAWLDRRLAAGFWDRDTALVAAALAYYLKVFDMIPDSLGPDMGLVDDAEVVSAIHEQVLGGGGRER